MRVLVLAAVAALLPVVAHAQSDLAPAHTSVSVSGSYAGAVSRSNWGSLGDFTAYGAAVDATYGRVTVGAGVVAGEFDTAVDLAAGFHLARRPDRQLTTTVGAAVQIVDDVVVVTPLVSHARRVAGSAGFAVVPGAAIGISVPFSDYGDDLSAVASGGVSFVLGRGPTRAAVTPSVAWTRGNEDVVSVGVTAGLVRSIGRR